MAPIDPNPQNNKLSAWGWQLLIVGLVWASLTGTFIAMPEKPVLRLAIALLISGGYAAGICQFRRPMMWVAIAVTIVINIVHNFRYPGEPIVYYVIAMTLSINLLLFGELGLQFLKIMNRFQTFLRLTGLLTGAFSFGWLLGVVFGHTPQ